MVNGLKSKCEQAEAYFYDFLNEEISEQVPCDIAFHISSCRECTKQIARLKEILSQDEPEIRERETRNAGIEMLELHFVHIDKEVTCKTVKAFLPLLVEPALKVRIPTPITVHLDNCEQCRKDMDVILQLGLNSEQLSRLSLLLSNKTLSGKADCVSSRDALALVAKMDFDGIEPEKLINICGCDTCRILIYQMRQERLNYLLKEKNESTLLCRETDFSDIFGYCLPYEVDFADSERASHIWNCKVCLSKLQKLHKVAMDIIHRGDSGVCTIYRTDSSAKTKIGSETDNLYSGFPIKVEVIKPNKKTVETERSGKFANFAALMKQKNFGPLVRVAAAAMVILAVTLMFINTPTAKAVTLQQIYEAIQKITNIHISKFTVENKNPLQEKWISRSQRIYLTKTEDEIVVWDLTSGFATIKKFTNGTVETAELTDDLLGNMEDKLGGYFGLVPFDSPSDVPSDAQWRLITDVKVQDISSDVEIYDLSWTDTSVGGSSLDYKWRGFIDTKTNLPVRIEWYRKFSTDTEFELTYIEVVSPLSDQELQSILKSFQ
ncbi:MAG: hypothetical protein PHF37_08910 [Phycisphaerae bacterium]|nr:hypothetical protein [Phycisphaerae bacterium]